MKTIALALAVFASIFVAGCDKSQEPSSKKTEQDVIFEYSTAKCETLCSFSNQRAEEMNCQNASKSLAEKRSQGWRVVSSSQKTIIASSSQCTGTEYVIER
jgi:hypothetical protein